MTAAPITIPAVLSDQELRHVLAIVQDAPWEDGLATAGTLSATVKHNQQLPEQSAAAQEAGALVTAALSRNPTFMAAALPARIVPPLFNRYRVGEAYGPHIDGALRHANGIRFRTDLSATLFLSAPDSYDGGELVIGQGAHAQAFRGGAGDLLLYPANTIHHVQPVAKGQRLACFFWIQSIIRDATQRQILWDLDQAIQSLAALPGTDGQALAFSQTYHNLVRLWADG